MNKFELAQYLVNLHTLIRAQTRKLFWHLQPWQRSMLSAGNN